MGAGFQRGSGAGRTDYLGVLVCACTPAILQENPREACFVDNYINRDAPMSHKLFRHSILCNARVWDFLKRADASKAVADRAAGCLCSAARTARLFPFRIRRRSKRLRPRHSARCGIRGSAASNIAQRAARGYRRSDATIGALATVGRHPQSGLQLPRCRCIVIVTRVMLR